MSEKVLFFNEDIDFNFPFKKSQIVAWLVKVCNEENCSLEEVTYIFCNDEYLYELNKKFLNHDTYTDILTFNLNDDPINNSIQAEIYISIDRIKENSSNLNITFAEEMARVMIHGVLHLIGYDDHNETDEKLMRLKESEYLALIIK